MESEGRKMRRLSKEKKVRKVLTMIMRKKVRSRKKGKRREIKM